MAGSIPDEPAMNRSQPGSPRLRPRQQLLVSLGLFGTLVLLLTHALQYQFLTDDAYIALRYARNLADGAGLVFNQGFERVEGYTNFLWVLVMAALHGLGVDLENAALGCSLVATVALWALVVWFAWRTHARCDWILVVLIPPLLLAATRSIAVWSTSGLETRFFELLVVAGAIRLIVEDEAMEKRECTPRPVAAVLLALATLTRPDGLLISLAVFSSISTFRWRSGRKRLPWLASSLVWYVVLVGGHYVFRYAYYGAWLPNTYYAKVDGHLWWGMGLKYLMAFALEYGVFLWLPFLAAAVAYHHRSRTLSVPVVFTSAILPHAVYIVAVGGDHFEFRPLDLYFPFAFLLMGAGAAFLARGFRSKALVAAGIGLVMVGIVELPYRSRVEFPRTYVPGFPGSRIYGSDSVGFLIKGVDIRTAANFLEPGRGLLYRLPGLRAMAETHQRLVRETSFHFVGLRQEEHKLFLSTVVSEGRALGELLERGILAPDTYVAIDCVGAMPYYSDLRILDRLGLTDAHVAASEFVNPDIMAHGKYATLLYARKRGVDFWAIDNVHLLWNERNPRLALVLQAYHNQGLEIHFSDVGSGNFLVAWLPKGIANARIRFPALEFRSTLDSEAVRSVVSHQARRQAPRVPNRRATRPSPPRSAP